MSPPESSAPTLLAAHLAIHALGVLAGSDRKVSWIIVNDVQLNPNDAVSALARLEKPVLCRATLADGALSIVTHRLTGPEERDWQEWTDVVAPENDRFIRDAYGQRGEPRILFGSASGHLLIPLAVYDQWQRDYKLPGIAFSIDDPRPGQNAFGAQAVLTMWRGKDDRFIDHSTGPWRKPD